MLGPWLAAASWVVAQHGHPLVGSWSGDWMPSGAPQQRLLLVLEYEDDALSGAVFFGTRRVPLSRASLDPSSWTVDLEASETDSSGARISYRIEGRIENLGSTTERTIVGRLSRNGAAGDFRVVMN